MIRVEVMLEFSSDTTSVQHHRASKKHLEVSTEKPAGGNWEGPRTPRRWSRNPLVIRGRTCGQGRQQMRQGTKKKDEGKEGRD